MQSQVPCFAGASRDPPEKQAPMCTVHSFPHNIDHCLTFARSEFEGLLEKSPSEANAFLADPAKYLSAVRQVRWRPLLLASILRMHGDCNAHMHELLATLLCRSIGQPRQHQAWSAAHAPFGGLVRFGVCSQAPCADTLKIERICSRATRQRGSSWRRWWRSWTQSAAPPLRTA